MTTEMTTTMSMQGKVAIVTGGGSGIGRASAVRFAHEGAAVMVADVRRHKAEETARMISSAGGTATATQVDVGDADDVARMVEETVDGFGRLDVLFNNAATVRPGGAIELAVEDWDLVWRTNVSSVFFGAKFAAPRMTDGGAIISTASVSGLLADAELIAYNATKAAVINLTRALAVDLTPRGIRVNCICPGIVMTPPTRAYMRDDVVRTLTEATLPARRLAQPEEIAAAAVWLAGDESSYVTGHALVVDGGLSIQGAGSLMHQVAARLAPDDG
jgi:NAD(P)-dependent dehydrogenase (short-subunit alcohol dehydrogenase family)